MMNEPQKRLGENVAMVGGAIMVVVIDLVWNKPTDASITGICLDMIAGAFLGLTFHEVFDHFRRKIPWSTKE